MVYTSDLPRLSGAPAQRGITLVDSLVNKTVRRTCSASSQSVLASVTLEVAPPLAQWKRLRNRGLARQRATLRTHPAGSSDPAGAPGDPQGTRTAAAQRGQSVAGQRAAGHAAGGRRGCTLAAPCTELLLGPGRARGACGSFGRLRSRQSAARTRRLTSHKRCAGERAKPYGLFPGDPEVSQVVVARGDALPVSPAPRSAGAVRRKGVARCQPTEALQRGRERALRAIEASQLPLGAEAAQKV